MIAETILYQLGRNVNRISTMIGAYDFVYHPNGVSFRFKARSTNGSNTLRITLASDDTYTVEFLSIRGSSRKVKETVSGVYCDQLKPMFEDKTGLCLSL